MKLKKGLSLLIALTLLVVPCGYVPEVQAADKNITNEKAGELNRVYLDNSGSDSADGKSAATPLKSMEKAFEKAADGGTIVIVDSYTSRLPVITPAGKSITVEGLSNSVYWSMRDYLQLGGNLTVNNLRLETISTDAPNRCIYANGYTFRTTDSATCFVNENINQKAFVYAGGHDNKKISGRKAVIDIKGNCQLAAVYGYGGGGSVVEEGTEVSIGGKAGSDIIDGGKRTVTTLNTDRKYNGQLFNLGLLRINAPASLYTLTGIGDIELNSTLELSSGNGISIGGSLTMGGDAHLNLNSNFTAAGEINGTAGLIGSEGLTITSGKINSDGRFILESEGLRGCSVETSNAGNSKKWTIVRQSTVQIYYLNGAAGDDSQDGLTEEHAFKTMGKLTGLTLPAGKETMRVVVTGDTTIPDAAVFEGKNYQFTGSRSTRNKLVFEKGLRTLGAGLSFEEIGLSFSELAGQEEIEQTGGTLEIDGDVTIEGKPDILSRGNGFVKLKDGSFGAVRNPARDGRIYLTNVILDGALEGFDQIDLEAALFPVVLDQGIADANMINFAGATSKLKINGDVSADWLLENPGAVPHISIRSGRQMNIGDISLSQLTVTVTPDENGIIAEDKYILSASSCDGVLRLKDMGGYLLAERPKETVSEYYLEKAEALPEPTGVKWSDDIFGRLTWNGDARADTYYYEVYVNGVISRSGVTSERYIDYGNDIKTFGGSYEVSVAAADSKGVYSDSPSVKSSPISYIPSSESPKVYNLSYHMGGGGTHTNPLSFGDTAVTLKAALRSGYLFEGWYEDSAYKNPASEIPARKDVSGDMVLYAKWEKISMGTPTVTKLINTNGQLSLSYSAVTGAKRYQIAYSDNSTFTKSSVYAASGTSAVIKGLSKGKNYYVKVQAGREDSTGNYIYGGFSAPGSIYQIKYVLNGGTNSTANPVSYLNNKVSLKNPARSKYVFKGWYTSSSYKTRVTTLTKGNYTLYAKWARVSVKKASITGIQNPVANKMTVSYSKVSGAKGYQIVYSTNKKFTKSTTKTVTTAAAKRTLTKLKTNTSYYVKVRAYALDSKGAKIYGAYSSSLVGYSIKYVLNGGKNNSANYIRYYNTSVSLKNPTRKGYVFKGWYTSKKYKTRIKSIKKGKRTNYKLYARWVKGRTNR